MSSDAKKANLIAVLTLAASLLGSVVAQSFYYGRISEKVDAIDQTQKIMLQHLLQAGERASR